jgi:Hypervirulence associated proteins TUDOR domain
VSKHFEVGDHVRWNSEAGHVSGRIIKIHTGDAEFKGYVHHASNDEPQFEILSDKTEHIAMHKGAVLHKID